MGKTYPILLLILVGAMALQVSLPHTRAAPSDLLVVVNTDKDVYLVGEQIRITVLITNQGQEVTTLHFSTTCQAAFSAEDSSRVWYDLRRHLVCGQMLTELTLQPGESASYSFTWNQVDDNKNQVPAPHQYVIRGIVLSWESVQPATKTITISATQTVTFDKTIIFDDVTVSVFGSATLDTSARTLTGEVTVTAVNNTSGETIFSKTFEISLVFGSSNSIKFVLEIPAVPVALGLRCTVDLSGLPAVCMLSRTPDINSDGVVNILDLVGSVWLPKNGGTARLQPGHRPQRR